MSLYPVDSDSRFFAENIRTVAVIGLGLLGGSLALRLKNCVPHCRVLGLARRRESIDQAVSQNIIDYGSLEADEILQQADISIICTPVSNIISLATKYADSWRRGAIVTDVGSVKAEIVKSLTPLLSKRGVNFVGSHPMAGSEKSGLAFAEADFYEGSKVLVTPVEGTDALSLALVETMWKLTGACPIEMPVDVHDESLGRTSHLTHLLAAAAVEVCLKAENAEHTTGGGFRDFTRIAASSPEMWKQIFEMNREVLIGALQEYQDELKTLSEWLQSNRWDEIEAYFDGAGKKRAEWLEKWNRQRQQQELQERA
ncbi:MAG: prephenate dehydrogenase [Lentisphaeria bacterium]